MSWEPEVKEIAKRRELRTKMGGPEGIERQHKRGKLTVRERIDALADEGSFREFQSLAGSSRYENNELVEFTPSASVGGLAKLEGRTIVLTGSDFTIRGGSGTSSGGAG